MLQYKVYYFNGPKGNSGPFLPGQVMFFSPDWCLPAEELADLMKEHNILEDLMWAHGYTLEDVGIKTINIAESKLKALLEKEQWGENSTLLFDETKTKYRLKQYKKNNNKKQIVYGEISKARPK